MRAEDPQEELARLSAAGRRRREAAASAARADEAAARAAAQRLEDRAARLMTFTSWMSLTRWASGFFWTFIALLLAMCAAMVEGTARSINRESFLVVDGIAASTVLLGVAGALLPLSILGVWSARRRDIAFRAGLPFATHGYEEVLSNIRRSVRVAITFAEPPPIETLQDLLVRVREPTRYYERKDGDVILEAEVRRYSLLDEHSRWVPRWYRMLTRRALLPMHKVHRIIAVTFL